MIALVTVTLYQAVWSSVACPISQKASLVAEYVRIQWHSMESSGYSDIVWPFPRVSQQAIISVASTLFWNRTPIPALPQTQKRQRSPDTSSSNSPKTPDTPEPEEGGFLTRRSRRGSLPKVQPQSQVVRLRSVGMQKIQLISIPIANTVLIR